MGKRRSRLDVAASQRERVPSRAPGSVQVVARVRLSDEKASIWAPAMSPWSLILSLPVAVSKNTTAPDLYGAAATVRPSGERELAPQRGGRTRKTSGSSTTLRSAFVD